MGHRRFIRSRTRRKKKSAMELEITSLLDILVILLVFLLKSYSTNTIVINIPKEITVPISTSQSPSSSAISIQVSKDLKIWVDDKLISDLGVKRANQFDQDGMRITTLYNELAQKKEGLEFLAKQTGVAPKAEGQVALDMANLIMDSNIEYQWIEKIMHTAGQAGFAQFKFVVIGDE